MKRLKAAILATIMPLALAAGVGGSTLIGATAAPAAVGAPAGPQRVIEHLGPDTLSCLNSTYIYDDYADDYVSLNGSGTGLFSTNGTLGPRAKWNLCFIVGNTPVVYSIQNVFNLKYVAGGSSATQYTASSTTPLYDFSFGGTQCDGSTANQALGYDVAGTIADSSTSAWWSTADISGSTEVVGSATGGSPLRTQYTSPQFCNATSTSGSNCTSATTGMYFSDVIGGSTFYVKRQTTPLGQMHVNATTHTSADTQWLMCTDQTNGITTTFDETQTYTVENNSGVMYAVATPLGATRFFIACSTAGSNRFGFWSPWNNGGTGGGVAVTGASNEMDLNTGATYLSNEGVFFTDGSAQLCQ